MDKSIAMKQQVLGMLKDFMMGEQGKKIKPKAIEVAMVTDKPKNLDEVLENASHDEWEDSPEDMAVDKALAKKKGMSLEEWEDSPEDEMVDEAAHEALESPEYESEEHEEEEKPKMSLKEFFKRK